MAEDISIKTKSSITVDPSVTAENVKASAARADVKASDKDTNFELAQLLGALQDVLDTKEAPALEDLDYVPTLERLDEAYEAATASLKENFSKLLEKVQANPSAYIPALYEDGEISPKKLEEFFQKNGAAVQAALKALKEKYDSVESQKEQGSSTSACSSSDTTTTTEESSDERFSSDASSSYVDLTKHIVGVTKDIGWIEAKLVEDAANQSEMTAKQNDAFIAASQKDLDDINKQIADIERQKRRQRRRQKTMGALTHIISGVSVALACCTMNPALIAVTVALAVDQEASLATRGDSMMTQGTSALAGVLVRMSGGMISNETAKIMADVLVAVVVATAAGGASAAYSGAATGSAAAAESGTVAAESSVTSTVASIQNTLGTGLRSIIEIQMLAASDFFGDVGDAIVKALHAEGTQLGRDIMISSEVIGAALCLGVSAGAASRMTTTAMGNLSTTMEKVLLAVTVILVTTDVIAQGTMAVMSGLTAANDVLIANQERDLAQAQADLSLQQALTSILTNASDLTIEVSNQEVSGLGATLQASLASIARGEQSTVTRV